MALGSVVNLPHTVTVFAATQVQEGDGDIRARSYADVGTAVECLIWDESPDAAFRAFGIELLRPVRLICDPSSKALFAVGNRVTYDGRTFEVAAPARTIAAGLSVDNTDVLLKDGQYD
jgi:hypothetical protein